MEKKFDDNDEIQIDLLELAYALKKKLWLIILGLIVGAFGAGLYSKILLTPIYKSTAMVYVLSKETTLTSLADLQIGSQLTKDYSVLVTSRPVLEQVIEKQQLDMRVDELERMISIGIRQIPVCSLLPYRIQIRSAPRRWQKRWQRLLPIT